MWLSSVFVVLMLLCIGGQSRAVEPIHKKASTYALQSDDAVLGSATRTVALQSVSSAACRLVASDAQKGLHRFVSYFNNLTPTPDLLLGGSWLSDGAIAPQSQGVRLARLRMMRI